MIMAYTLKLYLKDMYQAIGQLHLTDGPVQAVVVSSSVFGRTLTSQPCTLVT